MADGEQERITSAQAAARSTSAPAAGQPAGRLLTIGQVLKTLQDEFPDLSISKIRYLEERALISPQRTPGGYRKYSQDDVRRLHTVLTLQRDEFLPLNIIRERMRRSLDVSGAARVATPPAYPDSAAALKREESSVSWEEALEISGVSDGFMRQLVEYRLVERQPDGGGGYRLSESDVEIARVSSGLARFGVEARNLRLMRSAVEREVSVIEQIAAPALRSAHSERREEGERQVVDLGTLLSTLYQLLLYRDMRALIKSARGAKPAAGA